MTETRESRSLGKGNELRSIPMRRRKITFSFIYQNLKIIIDRFSVKQKSVIINRTELFTFKHLSIIKTTLLEQQDQKVERSQQFQAYSCIFYVFIQVFYPFFPNKSSFFHLLSQIIDLLDRCRQDHLSHQQKSQNIKNVLIWDESSAYLQGTANIQRHVAMRGYNPQEFILSPQGPFYIVPYFKEIMPSLHYKLLPMQNFQIQHSIGNGKIFGLYCLQQQKSSKTGIIFFNLILHLLRILLSGSAWMISNSPVLSNQIIALLSIFNESVLYNTIFFLLIIIKVIAIFLIYFKYKRTRNFLLQKIIIYKAKFFRQYKQLDLVFTTYMLAVNGKDNIMPFCLSLLLECYDMIFVQDFIVRKSLSYAKSVRSYFFYRFYVISVYVVDAITIHLQTAQIYNSCFFGVILLFLVRFSYAKMRIMGMQALNRMISIELFIYVSMFYSTCSHQFEEVPFNINTITQCFFIVVVLFLYSQLRKRALLQQLLSTQPHSSIKQYDLSLTFLLQQQQNDLDMNVLTEGMLAFHKFDNCLNPSCFAKKPSVYDPLSNKVINTLSCSSHKASLMKMHIQCLYEDCLSKNALSNQAIFNYCEFLYNESGNKTKLMTLLLLLQNKDLGFIQRIVYNRFQLLLSATFRQLNDSQYEGNLPFELVIGHEQRIQFIQERIETYLLRNCHIWTLFGKSQVEVGLIRQQFHNNLKIIEQLDKEWKGFGCFLNASKKWRRVYFNYLLFIKNQKIKNKDIQDVKGLLPAKIKLKSQHSEDRQPYQPEIFNISILFDHNAIFFKAVLQGKQLLITNVCQKFQEKTGHNRQTLTNCELDVILPEELAKTHNDKVYSWMDQCYEINESSYLVKESDLITKKGASLPVIKLFKVCYSIENGLEFACFLSIQDQSNRKIHNENEMCFSLSGQNLIIDSLYGSESQNQNSSNIRQINQSNIFLKEQESHRQSQDCRITRFKCLGRLITLTVVCFLLISLITVNTNNNHLITHSNQFINLMHIYRLPIILNINYLKSSLKIGNATKAGKAITASTNTMLSFLSNPLTISTIFDPKINEPRMYHSDGGYDQLANMTYNQIDLFYTITSSIMSLSKGPVNRTSKEYKQFSTFLKPAYDNMINGTKNRLHKTFKVLIQDSYNSQMYIFVGGVIIFLALFILMFLQLAHFFRRMKAVTSIIKDFPERHVRIIEKYCRDVRQHFLVLSQRSRPTHLESNISNQNNDKGDNLNKKPKNLLERQSKHSSRVTIVRVVFFITQTITIALLAMLVLFNLSQINSIYKFQEAGFYFLRYFPTGPIITMGAVEKYYSLTYPQQKLFNASKYDDVISSMDLFGNFPYIGSTQDKSLYLQKQKNYFFGNPCTYNPSLLTIPDVSISTCLTISNGTFSQGISSYLRYSQRLGSRYIRGETNMTVSEVNEYTVSVTILTVYVLDAISTWIAEFISNIQHFHNFNIAMGALIFSAIVLLHIISNEWIVRSLLRKEHLFILQLYRCYVPQFLLEEEKVIRQRFIIEGLIDKD